MKTVIHFQNVARKLHGSTYFRVQDLKVAEHEAVVLYGLSEDFIELLVNQLTGAYPPEEGSLSILGINTSEIEEDQWFQLIEKISVYHPRSAFLESASIGENVASSFRATNETVDEPQLSASVLNISNLVQLTITDLSKIMSEANSSLRMKVRLARALAFRPKVLILSNPTEDLAPHVTREFVELLRRAKRKQKFTLIVFTTDIWLTEQLAERVIFLNPTHGVFIENQIRGWYHKFFPFLSPAPDRLLQLSMNALQHSRMIKAADAKIGKH